MPLPLYPRGKKEPPVPIMYRKLDEPQNWSGCFEVEENNFSMPEIEPQLSSLQSIALLTELSEFLNMSS
jgi:hypothetical protein